MIAKIVTRKTQQGKGFASLARYVGNEKKIAAGYSGFGATAEYAADLAHDGAKLSGQGVRFSNLSNDNLKDAVLEVELTQRLCRNSKAAREMHLVISFPPGENPPIETLHSIEDELLKSIGLERHGRMSACHSDKIICTFT